MTTATQSKQSLREIASKSALLMQDLQMLILKLDDSERVNQNLPTAVYTDSVRGSLTDLRKAGIKLEGIDTRDGKMYDRAKEVMFELKNQSFEVTQ